MIRLFLAPKIYRELLSIKVFEMTIIKLIRKLYVCFILKVCQYLESSKCSKYAKHVLTKRKCYESVCYKNKQGKNISISFFKVILLTGQI